LSPMNRANYPADWEGFSKGIRFTRAGGRCECVGECGVPHGVVNGERCPKKHLAIYADVACILTVAHLNARGGPCRCEPRCAKPEHVKAMCQGCHLRYDHERHQLNASNTRDKKRGQLRLPLDQTGKEIDS
jgi:hypothetical protein